MVASTDEVVELVLVVVEVEYQIGFLPNDVDVVVVTVVLVE